jgi:tetratricopeptide (TPR) repeat protein
MDDRLKQLLSTGRELYAKGDFDRAEPCLREVAAEAPGFADVQNMLGVIFHHQGKYDLSRRAFERALKLNPRYTEAALNLAVTYNELGKYAEAKAVYENIVDASRSGPRRLDPFASGKIANMHADLARAYEDVRMYEEAAREYREALALCPEFADLRTRLAHALRDSGNIEAAIVEYREAKDVNPSYVPARVHLGVALFAIGQKQEALAEWQQALALDPQNQVAGTYMRMVRQLAVQEEAAADGVPIDVRPEEGTVAAKARDRADKRVFYRPERDAGGRPSAKPGLDDADTVIDAPLLDTKKTESDPDRGA